MEDSSYQQLTPSFTNVDAISHLTCNVQTGVDANIAELKHLVLLLMFTFASFPIKHTRRTIQTNVNSSSFPPTLFPSPGEI